MKQNKEKKQLTKKQKIIRSIIVCTCLAGFFALLYGILVWTGVWEKVNSVEKVRTLILSLGFWGRLVFVLLQFLQVTFVPIPSTVTTLAGVLIYGPLEAALLSLSGLFVGSCVAFALGKYCGKKLVVFMVGEETCNKWANFLYNAKYSFVLMMIMPFFPDDVLCLVAGLTPMSWPFFVITNFVARPIGVFITCYFGGGYIIPYKGWGLAVWAVVIVVAAALLYLSVKYRKQIEEWLLKTFAKKKYGQLMTKQQNEIATVDNFEIVVMKEIKKHCKNNRKNLAKINKNKQRKII